MRPFVFTDAAGRYGDMNWVAMGLPAPMVSAEIVAGRPAHRARVEKLGSIGQAQVDPARPPSALADTGGWEKQWRSSRRCPPTPWRRPRTRALPTFRYVMAARYCRPRTSRTSDPCTRGERRAPRC